MIMNIHNRNNNRPRQWYSMTANEILMIIGLGWVLMRQWNILLNTVEMTFIFMLPEMSLWKATPNKTIGVFHFILTS